MEPHIRTGLEELTETRQRVLAMVAAGRTNAEIATVLGISLDGAKWHVREIMSKLQVETREEAADAWREDRGLGRRLWRQLLRALAPAQRLLASGKAAIAAGAVMTLVVAGVAVTLVTLGDGGAPPAREPATTAASPTTGATSEAAATVVSASPTARPSTEAFVVERYGPGETVGAQSGILLFDTTTGGSVAWHVTPLSRPSPSGRYLVIGGDCNDTISTSSSTAGSCAYLPAELLDTTTGVARPITIDQHPAIDARVTADESHLVAVSERSVALFALPQLTMEARTGPSPERSLGGATFAYSADGNMIAVTVASAVDGIPTPTRTDIVTDDNIIQSPVAGMLAWAHHSNRLAIIGATSGVIIDATSGAVIPLARGSGRTIFNQRPEWSPDDRYIATPFDDGVTGVTSFDAGTGAELVRVYGAPGCPVLWNGTDTLLGSYYDENAGQVSVPGGQVTAGWPQPRPSAGTHIEARNDGTVQLVAPDGSVRASARVAVAWSMPFNWSWEWPDGPPPTALLLGGGGRDACGGSSSDVTVVLPPFDTGEIPSATPTRTH